MFVYKHTETIEYIYIYVKYICIYKKSRLLFKKNANFTGE